jgi:hypothetical protein
MPAAVFGDFLAAASEHLEAAVTVREEDLTRPPAVAEELSRLVAVMSRYCDDLAPCDRVEASGRDDLHPWERAAIDAAGALRIDLAASPSRPTCRPSRCWLPAATS